MTFEARLTNALERYAERVPAEMDISAVARAATASPARRAGMGRPLSWARWSVALRLGVAVALLALAALLIALIGRPRDPTLGGGKLMVSLGTTGWVFEPTLGTPREVVAAVGCATSLVDGGAQLATGVRFGPFRLHPVGGDADAFVAIARAEIPGYGGTNSEWWSPDGSMFVLARYGQQNDDDPPDGIGAIRILSIHGTTTPGDAVVEIPGLSVFAFSDDSRHVAALGRRGDDVELFDLDLVRGVKRSVATYRSPTEDTLVQWTAGGSKVAVWLGTPEGDRPALVDAASGAITIVRLAPELTTPQVGAWLSWSPDGTRATVFGSNAGGTVLAANGSRLYDLPRGTAVDTFRGPTSWSPDSRHLLVLDGDVLHVVRADDGHVVGSLSLGGAMANSQWFAWSTDGGSVAVATPGAASLELAIYDASTLERTASATISTRPPVTGEGMCLQWVRPVD
jgi:hypothetical protein